jgi:hypothetical protein
MSPGGGGVDFEEGGVNISGGVVNKFACRGCSDATRS